MNFDSYACRVSMLSILCFLTVLNTGLTITSLSEATLELSDPPAAIYYVAPSNTSCPHEVSTSTCLTFEEYLFHGTFSHSETTFLFLPGVHMMDRSLIVENTVGLSLEGIGDHRIFIRCSKSNLGFSFFNVRCLILENIQIHNCSQEVVVSENNNLTVFSGLFFGGGQNVTLNNISVINGGMFIRNTLGQVTINKSKIISYISVHQRHTFDTQSFGGNYLDYRACNVPTNLTIVDSAFEFYNHSWFFKNLSGLGVISRPSGVKITLYCTNVRVNILRSNFSGYKGLGDGGNMALILQNNSNVYNFPVSVHDCLFTQGLALQGGGVYVSLVQVSADFNSETYGKSYPIVSLENTTFQNNTAVISGGAVCFKQKESSTSHSILLVGVRNCTFLDNFLIEKGYGGIAMHILNFITIKYSYHPNPQFKTTITGCTFQSHYIINHTHCFAGNGVIFVTHNSYLMVRNSVITTNNCTAIMAIGTNLIFEGTTVISHNRGSSGGGLMFCENSIMFLKPYTNVTISYNEVVHAGGGICVEAECLQSKPMCFYQLDKVTAHNISLLDTISVNLINNSAPYYAGHDLFGGSVDKCYIIDSPEFNAPPILGLQAFHKIFQFSKALSPSSVTSIPRRICFCKNESMDCLLSRKSISVYPGEPFPIEAVPIGQLNGTVPGAVHAFNDFNEPNCLKVSGKVQKIGLPKCSHLEYTVISNKSTEIIHLQIQHDGDISGYERIGFKKGVLMEVSLKPCPIGFSLTNPCNSNQTLTCYCQCSAILKRHFQNISCHIKDQTINISRGWIGYTLDPCNLDSGEKYLAYKELCPLNFCCPSTVTFRLDTLNDSTRKDIRCQFNRTGILCGSCRENLSMILGTSDCWSCSNRSLALLPLFAFAGVFLIFFLTLLNFTIAEGTLSGLIFYANVIQIGQSSFFPTESTWFISFLRVFISWINLDFGISACLYDGMDAYAKAWFQFVFPLYIWGLSGLIVCLCHRYIFFTRLIGKNSVKVLATLILLSYTKILRTIIVTMSFVIVKFHIADTEYDVHNRFLWMYDAKIPYLQKNSKHIYLFVCGLVFSLLYIPFMIFMLLVQHMPKLSKFRGFSWIQKMKPFLDSYIGMNTRQGRFWTGLLLLCRTFLCAVNIARMNTSNRALIYISYVCLVCIVLLLIFHCLPSGVYLKHKLNFLESFFLLNLLALCAGSAFTNTYGDSSLQIKFFGISVGLTFAVFIGLLVLHVWKRMENTSRGIALKEWVLRKIRLNRRPIQNIQHNANKLIEQYPPLSRFNEDREPLLASIDCRSYH